MCTSAIAGLVRSGDLFSARRAAVDYCRERSSASASLRSPFGTTTQSDPTLNSDAVSECVAAWKAALDDLLVQHGAGVLVLVDAAHRRHSMRHEMPRPLNVDCAHEQWDRCCSTISSVVPPVLNFCHHSCCVMGNGTRAHTRLPLLRETSLTVRLPSQQSLHIEQDGLLRPFDVSTVLWPAGYLLSLWVADPLERSKWPQIKDRPLRVLDLGTGTGAVAIAAAISGSVSVVATDASMHSLLLVAANSALAGVHVEIRKLDWDDDEDVSAAVSHGGPYDLITGAALQFERWETRMWTVLRQLTWAPANGCLMSEANALHARTEAERDGVGECDVGQAVTAGSLVALAHTTGSIQEPIASSHFVEEGRIPGMAYGMHTRWSDTDSEFEIVLMRRQL